VQHRFDIALPKWCSGLQSAAETIPSAEHGATRTSSQVAFARIFRPGTVACMVLHAG
jgi:hypothetical protein